MQTENYDRIEQFLRDKMSPQEKEVFLNDLRNNKKLRKEAQMMALMIKEMREEQAKQDAEIIEEVLASKKKAKIITIVRRTLSIAAIIQKTLPHEAEMKMLSIKSLPTYLLEWEQKKTLPPLLIDYKPFMIILWQIMRNMMNTNIPKILLIGILLWLT